MFSFLGPTYFVSDPRKRCSETGDIAVEDLTKCKEAAEKLGFQFKATENTADFPKGCYVFTLSLQPKGFFNTHDSGDSNNNSRALCTRPAG